MNMHDYDKIGTKYEILIIVFTWTGFKELSWGFSATPIQRNISITIALHSSLTPLSLSSSKAGIRFNNGFTLTTLIPNSLENKTRKIKDWKTNRKIMNTREKQAQIRILTNKNKSKITQTHYLVNWRNQDRQDLISCRILN